MTEQNKPIGRRIFTILSAGSAVLCVGLVILWVVSVWFGPIAVSVKPSTPNSGGTSCGIWRGNFVVYSGSDPCLLVMIQYPAADAPEIWEANFRERPISYGVRLIVPLYFLVTFAAILPSLWLFLWWRPWSHRVRIFTILFLWWHRWSHRVRFFTILSALSGVMCVGLAILWVVAALHYTFIPVGNGSVSVEPNGTVGVTSWVDPHNGRISRLFPANTSWRLMGVGYSQWAQLEVVVWGQGTVDVEGWMLEVHIVWLLALTAILPALWVFLWWRWRRWRRLHPPGHCQHCGYDLRASVGECPECGEPIPPKVSEA